MTNETIDALLAILEEEQQLGLRDFVQRVADRDLVHGTSGKKKEEGVSLTGYNVPWIRLNAVLDETAAGVSASGITELLSVIADVEETPVDPPDGEPPGQQKKAFKSTAPYGPPVTVSVEEVAALPGYVEFIGALQALIVQKSIETQTPPPVEEPPVEPPLEGTTLPSA